MHLCRAKLDIDEGATASALFEVIASHGLVPQWSKNSFMGVVTIRNKTSAHGQGAQPKALPPYMADLAVNLAASYIVVLMAAHDSFGRS